jgi:hypothetical protein
LQPSPLVVLPSSQTSPVSMAELPHTTGQSLSLLWLPPAGQQLSPLAGPVIALCAHCRVHALPATLSRVHGRLSLQSAALAGQLPSHSSPVSTTLFGHFGAQSRSVTLLALGGQQPSPATVALIGACAHCRAQALPVTLSVVQAMLSLQSAALAGQLPSHDSPLSTTLFGQIGLQSESLLAFAPVGQQPSPDVATLIGACTHCRAHALPVTLSVVQAMLSLQSAALAGQLPSHSSPFSTTLFPHTGRQSESVLALAPTGQHLSPLAGALILTCVHSALQLAALPVSISSVQASLSVHVVGQGVELPASQVSPAALSMTPSPHLIEQSASSACVQPEGQQ